MGFIKMSKKINKQSKIKEKPALTIKNLDKKQYMTGGTFACSGCNAIWGERLVLMALGKNTIMINSAGCMTLTATYPFTPYKIPWVHGAIENAAAIGSGIYRGLKAQNKHKNINIVPYAGDGASYDIGLQAISGAVDRKEHMIYICYNNGNFANTGHQRSSATQYGARTSTTPIGAKNKIGNILPRKHLSKMLAIQGAPYVATASTSNPLDLINKLNKAKKIQGFKFIDLLTPCIPGWGINENQGYKAGGLMVDSCVWPLYEIENGKFNLTYKPKKKIPIKTALTFQKRFKHLSQTELNKIQRQIDKEWKLLLKGKYYQANEY